MPHRQRSGAAIDGRNAIATITKNGILEESDMGVRLNRVYTRPTTPMSAPLPMSQSGLSLDLSTTAMVSAVSV